MKKYFTVGLAALLMFASLCGCGGSGTASETPGASGTSAEEEKDYVVDENGNYVYELFLDPKFEQGFNVSAAGAAYETENGYPTDYQMLLPGQTKYSWLCSQWGCKYGFGDSYGNELITGHAPYEVQCIDGEYQYECYNEEMKLAHALRVNPTKGKITFDMMASVEYTKDGVIVPRKNSEYWPHLLISQGFKYSPVVKNTESLILTADVKINKCTDMHPEGTYDPSLHAAQFLMYLVVKSDVADPNNSYMWFGIPFFDNRYPSGMAEGDQIDSIENKFLYSVPQTAYAPEGVREGTEFKVNLNVIPYMERALKIAQDKYQRFVGVTVDNLYVSGMNVGWELPGCFDVSASLSNYSLKATCKTKL